MASAALLGAFVMIVGGAVDDGDPAAVALIDDGGGTSCSGVLVAPRVVVTAAHCVGAAGVRPDVAFGTDVAAPLRVVAVLDARVHPTADLALLLLGEEVADVLPAGIGAGAAAGEPLRLVGHGATEAGGAGGVKHTATTAVAEVDGAVLLHAGGGAPRLCVGDGGGAALLDDVLVAIHGPAGEPCEAAGRSTLLAPYVNDFVTPYVAATAEGVAAEGARCWYPENCAWGTCTPALDGTGWSFCAARCGDGCAEGFVCEGDLCVHPAPSPGALGTECTGAFDCVSSLCTGGACATPCVPVADDCPVTFTCAPRPDDPGYACQRILVDPACRCEAGATRPRGRLAGALALVAAGALALSRPWRSRRGGSSSPRRDRW